MSVAFCKTYAQLINLSTDASPDTFYSTEDYHKLNSLGPSLPKLNFPLPKSGAASNPDANVDIQLKSIRPPFKFSTALAAVSTAQSVYKVKEMLISAEESLKTAGVTPSNLKFMIKSKVISDTTPLATLVGEGTSVSITVMVSAPAATPAPGSAPTPADVAKEDSDPSESVPLSLSAATWGKIGAVLTADVGAENGKIFLEKFRAVV